MHSQVYEPFKHEESTAKLSSVNLECSVILLYTCVYLFISFVEEFFLYSWSVPSLYGLGTSMVSSKKTLVVRCVRGCGEITGGGIVVS